MMSLWENEAAMRAYESSDILQKTILPQLEPFFSGDYTTTRCEVRFAEELDRRAVTPVGPRQAFRCDAGLGSAPCLIRKL